MDKTPIKGNQLLQLLVESGQPWTVSGLPKARWARSPATLTARCKPSARWVFLPNPNTLHLETVRMGHSVTDVILREHCTSLLGRFKTPKYFCMVQDLPRGPSGKVQRLKLPNLPECQVLLG
jgi:acyl-CoA synthetase (AMP-forming)/AMP-acid ligase II